MSEKKRKNRWLLPAIIAALAIAVTVLALVNRDFINLTLAGLKEGEVVVRSGGEEIGRFDMVLVKGMEKVEFNDHIKQTGEAPVDAKFGGVLLKDVFIKIGLDISGYTGISYKAMDGYTSAGSIGEVLMDGKVYIVYERNGQPSGSRAEGGTGPLEIIIANEQFSLRNCKYLMEIDLEK